MAPQAVWRIPDRVYLHAPTSDQPAHLQEATAFAAARSKCRRMQRITPRWWQLIVKSL